MAFPGITAPFKDATLSSTVPGTVREVLVEEGNLVEEGTTLLELDKTLEELEVARRKIIWESKVEVESATDRVKTVKKDLEGTRRLFESTQSVSSEELDQKELEYKLALAELGRLKITEQREEMEYHMAVEQLERRIIKTPLAGTVTRLHLEEGENCEPGQPLVRVVDTSRCRFVCNLDAALARQLREEQEVRLEIAAGESTIEVDGHIVFISPVVDPASGLQEVKAEFDNANGAIWPGVAGRMLLGSPTPRTD
jgi:RND family efflux transporter MFP subunit